MYDEFTSVCFGCDSLNQRTQNIISNKIDTVKMAAGVKFVFVSDLNTKPVT